MEGMDIWMDMVSKEGGEGGMDTFSLVERVVGGGGGAREGRFGVARERGEEDGGGHGEGEVGGLVGSVGDGVGGWCWGGGGWRWGGGGHCESLRWEWVGGLVVGSVLGRCIVIRIWLIGLWFDSVGEVLE